MRRGFTVLVVVVVAAIALAAGFDALRGGSEPAAQTDAPTVSTTAEPEAPGSEPALQGTLYYTDEHCELRAIELPEARPVDAPGWDDCRFVLSPSERRVSGAGSGWDTYSDPNIGRLFESEEGRIQVATNLGPDGEPFRGTAPAWRPDGTVTYFADGAVRAWPEGDIVLSQRELLRAVRGVPFRSRPQALSLRDAAWLDEQRLAVIVSTRVRLGEGQDMLGIYEGDRLATWRLHERDRASDLRVSPLGTFVAARIGRDRFDMLDASGESVDTLGIVGYRAIAWSPDDRWAGVAADGGVFIFQPGVPGRPELELALDAHDLAWHG